MDHAIHILTESDVRQSIDMAQALQLARVGLIAEAEGRVVGDKFYMPLGSTGFIKPFSGHLAGERLAFVKTFSFLTSDSGGGVQPATNSQVYLYEVSTGDLVCLMAGNWVTGLRTGASTALTAEALAHRDSRIMTLFGAGVQGRHHIEALCQVLPLERIYLVDKNVAKAGELARSMAPLQSVEMEAIPFGEHRAAVSQADILITVTSGDEPLIEWPSVKRGAFIARLGSNREIAPEVILRANKFVVDRWDYVAQRVPELKALIADGTFSEEDLHGEWPDIAAGRVPARENEDEVIVYIALGIWGEYAAILPEVYRRAREKGLGERIAFDQRVQEGFVL